MARNRWTILATGENESMKSNTLNLSIALSQEVSFVASLAGIRITLNLVHPTTTNSLFAGKKRSEVPCPIWLQGLKFLLHSSYLSRGEISLLK